MKKRIAGPAAVVSITLAASVFVTVRAAHSAHHLDAPATKADPTVDSTISLVGRREQPRSRIDLVPRGDDGVEVLERRAVRRAHGERRGLRSHEIERGPHLHVRRDPEDSCWLGTDEYVTGDASAITGLTSADGKLKVFAGLRADPFFFNLDGFHHAEATVEGGRG